MSATLTFDQMERSADQTLAFVLWAKNVKNMALAAAWMAVLDRVAKHLVKTLSHDQKKLASLSDEQAMDLAKKLQEVHSQMDFLLCRTTVAQWRTKMLFAASLDGIADSTADIADILEDLILSCNPEFRSMLTECVRALPSRSVELVGRM
jgi:hypothetical protein